METLKSCPFCGATNLHVFIDTEDGNESHGIQCAGCWMSSSEKGSKDEATAAWNRRAAIQQAAGAVPEGCRIVPMEPSKAMLDRAAAFALNVSLGGSYGWTDYMRDLYARMLSAVPSKAGSSVHLGGGEGGWVPRWQPIETAPKASKAILVHCADRKNTYTATWAPDEEFPWSGKWKHFPGGFIDEAPTHWMPMLDDPAPRPESPGAPDGGKG